jgi:putative addiction module killer protein
MCELRQTVAFRQWLAGLADRRAVEKIGQRLVRLEAGLMGDSTSVGGRVSELRIDYGPGTRVYFTRRRRALIVLLCGGDKSSQKRDIKVAQTMVDQLKDRR